MSIWSMVSDRTHPLHEHKRRLQRSLGTSEGKAEAEVGNLLLQQDSQPLFYQRELLLLVVGDGADAPGSENGA